MKSFIKLYKKSFRHHDFVGLVNNPTFLCFLELPSLTASDWSEFKLFLYSNGFLVNRLNNSIISQISKNLTNSVFLNSFSGNVYVISSLNHDISLSTLISSFNEVLSKYSFIRPLGFLLESSWLSSSVYNYLFRNSNSLFGIHEIFSVTNLYGHSILGYIFKKELSNLVKDSLN